MTKPRMCAFLAWQVRADQKSRTYYAQANEVRPDGTRGIIKLHRFLWRLWAFAPTPEIDHENTNGLDCRQDNLRPATKEQNGRNTKIRADNKSGFKGVSWRSDIGKWQAHICANGRSKALGVFDDPALAATAYGEAAADLYGEFARIS